MLMHLHPILWSFSYPLLFAFFTYFPTMCSFSLVMVMAYLPIKTYLIIRYPFIERYSKNSHRWQFITLSTSVSHRHLIDQNFLEVSLLKICFIASHNCCAFCQTFIAPYLNFNIRKSIFHRLHFHPKWKQISHGVFA